MELTSSLHGERSLPKLLSTLELSMHPSIFVFLTFPPSTNPPTGLFQQMMFREAEGLTVISTLGSAEEHGLSYTFPSRMITCEVHSSLQAVGFIAEMARVLAEHDLAVNPVSGFYHDHLFILTGGEQVAIAALKAMALRARSQLEKQA